MSFRVRAGQVHNQTKRLPALSGSDLVGERPGVCREVLPFLF